MEQSSIATPRSSGIPRLSRLPIPRGLENPVTNHNPVKYPVKSLRTPRKAAQDASLAAAFTEPKQKATSDATSGDINPANDLYTGHDQTDEALASAPLKTRTLPRRPRPSLSDRTIETLSQIPPSPSPRRRRSSFFSSESPPKLSSRPGSSLSRPRPGTSHGHHPPLPSGPSSRPASPAKRHLAPTTGNQILNATPSKRSISSYHPKFGSNATTDPYGVGKPTPLEERLQTTSSSPGVKESEDPARSKPSLRPLRGSKTLAARPSKSRPSVQDVFAKPLGKPIRETRNEPPSKPRAHSPSSSAVSSEPVPPFSTFSKRSSPTPSDSGEPPSVTKLSNMPKVPSSSAALRETIAKAKAARQRANQIQSKGLKGGKQQAEGFPNFDFGDTSSILRNRVASARTDGRLNIAALGLKMMPPEVMNMYSANLGDGAWYESVDLVRLIAADNEFEKLDDATFPDEAPGSHEGEDEYQGNLFGGLETLDLHGNHLQALPMGLRRLERLTSLNVSKNRLGNSSMSTISQIRSLRELRLAGNALNGTLSDKVCTLDCLEVLDLHDNAISALPSNIDQLSHLRAINLAGNGMKSLPFECLSELPLVELEAARNRLSGALFPPGIQELANLKSLDIANNALISITQNNTIHLPSLQTINVTENRLLALPDMSGWTECITLIAGGNQLSVLPEGLTSLPRLKTVDFSRNDIRKLDPRLGVMDSLTVLRVTNNPVRERRFLNMDTDDIKRELKAQLISENAADILELEPQDVADGIPIASAAMPKVWPVKPGGILDRSSTKLEIINPADLEPFMQTNDVKTFILSRNQLQEIPQAISLLGHSLKKLDLSHNKLANISFLPSTLSLPSLTSLNLSSNVISNLSPVLDNLSAPRLAELDISRNRLASFPQVRRNFPYLTSLLAADNSICVLEVELARGLHVLDVSGNELTHLEPKLGLLGAEGLRTFIVGGNRFRVPRRDVIDKGTEAVLVWLKSRIPEGES